MERVMIGQLKEHVDREVTVCGWVHALRNQGKIKFIIIRDITGLIQVVVLKDKTAAFAVTGSLSGRIRSESHRAGKSRKTGARRI